uniref:Uncharacterized protein n=1 Tax=viral metagenome TaxID=1070528 RepID=A0A6C0JHA7_9ZZZZ
MEISIPKTYIYKIISSLDMGKIDRITEIPLRNNSEYKRIIIKFQWNDTEENSVNLKNQLETFGSLKIVHDMPWYWKVVSTHPQI